MTVDDNRELIVGAFAAWSRGERNAFRLLADDATWTIAGSSSMAGTYRGRDITR
ncbi:MAG: hypothetical protein HYX53_16335 [Chloroflexi bacterium]|nr:hypothetical protein [Chloroflexota bacterium]